MKTTILCIFFSICFLAQAQLTYVPDDAFEAFIETSFPAASNGNVNDNYVLTSGIQNIFYVNILGSNHQILDYTGLQDFTGIHVLTIMAQNATIIDLSLYANTSPPFGYLNVEIQSNNLLQTVIMPHNDINLKIQWNSFLQNIVFQNSNKFEALNSVIEVNNSLKIFDISYTAGVVNGASINIQNNPQLQCVNLKNGNCANWLNVTIEGNSELVPSADDEFESLLKCVQVDNPSYSQNSSAFNWDYYFYDPATYIYSTNCLCSLNLPDKVNGTTIDVYPNPAQDLLNLSFNESFNGKTFIISDELGRQVISGSIYNPQTSVDLSSISKGAYFISVNDTYYYKFIKE